MEQKRVLFLGGAPTQLPPIKYAKEQGYYVITCDYLPENPGHKLADEYHNVSTTDLESVLELATKCRIDGVVAYASDPAAPTAAYVAEKLNITGNPFESVNILARKDLFRGFLENKGFNVPLSKSFSSLEDAKPWLVEIGVPAFVKPVDSSGSKGVTRINSLEELSEAFSNAASFSRAKKIVVEQAIIRKGYQVDSDIFMQDGKVLFWIWGNQHQDPVCHKYAPIGISFPSVLAKNVQQKAIQEIEGILVNLGFQGGAFNVEFIIDENDRVWVIEIGPRNGGNLIPEVIKYATYVDMAAMTVENALGNHVEISHEPKCAGYWSSYIVHARESGQFKELWIDERIRSFIVEEHIKVFQGEHVNKFAGSHDTLGTMILRFPDKETMLNMLDEMEKYIRVITE